MILSKNSIFLKIFKLFFISLLFISVSFAVYSISIQKKMLISSLENEVKNINKLILFVLSDSLILKDRASIVEFSTEYIKNNEKLKNIIISEKENSYIIIKKNAWSYDDKIEKNFNDLQKEYDTFSLLESSILQEKVFHYVAPIYISGVQWGWIHLSMSLEEYNNRLNSIYIDFFTFFAILLLISISISYTFSKSISNPIVELNNIANKISMGDLEVRSNYKSNDELGALANTFNKMIIAIEQTQTQLKSSHEELEEKVNQRTKQLATSNKLLYFKKNELEELNRNLDKRIKEEIEKRIQQENILIQQSRLAATGEMIGNIAHQWRQPLNNINLLIYYIRDSYGKLPKEELDETIKNAKLQIDFMSQTIDDFRNFYKPSKGKRRFDIKESIIQSSKIVKSSLEKNSIKLEIEAIKIEIDNYENEFEQVIVNILNNAIDAKIIKEKQEKFQAKIKIKIYKEEEKIHICIFNNCGNIDEKIIERIFEPYFTTKFENQGTGIGLYMTKVIIEKNMNGKIEAQNKDDGVEFLITLNA